MTRVLSALSFVFAFAVLTAEPSRADIPPPEVELCSGKSVGDACDGGTCQEASCGRATPDGVVSYACVKCLPDASAKPASEKKNCGAAPDAMLWGLSGLAGLYLSGRRRRAGA